MLSFLCAQFFRSVQSTCTELLKVIEKYQHRITRESETAGHDGCGGASKERVHFFFLSPVRFVAGGEGAGALPALSSRARSHKGRENDGRHQQGALHLSKAEVTSQGLWKKGADCGFLWPLTLFLFLLLQDGALPPAAAHAPGSGDVPAPRHRRHAADRYPHGEVSHRVQRSPALDEGRLSGAGPGHLQGAGEVPQGRRRRALSGRDGSSLARRQEITPALFVSSGPSPGPRDQEPVWQAEERRVSKGGHARGQSLQHAVPLTLHLPGETQPTWTQCIRVLGEPSS